jgi:hypothetical protein
MVNFWNDYLYLEALGNLKRLNIWHSLASHTKVEIWVYLDIWIIMIDGIRPPYVQVKSDHIASTEGSGT